METNEVLSLYTLKQNANQHLKNKNYQNSIIYFSDILKKFDRGLQKIQSEEDMQKLIKQIKIPSHKNLSLCYLKLNNYRNSVKQCEQVLKIEPNNLKIIYRIGKSLIALEKYDQAQKYLKRGFAINPHQQEILKLLQQIQISKQNKKKCQDSSLKKLICLIFYWPLLIFNTFLAKIFKILGKEEILHKQN